MKFLPCLRSWKIRRTWYSLWVCVRLAVCDRGEQTLHTRTRSSPSPRSNRRVPFSLTNLPATCWRSCGPGKVLPATGTVIRVSRSGTEIVSAYPFLPTHVSRNSCTGVVLSVEMHYTRVDQARRRVNGGLNNVFRHEQHAPLDVRVDAI